MLLAAEPDRREYGEPNEKPEARCTKVNAVMLKIMMRVRSFLACRILLEAIHSA
jgi:hypothetical protein